MQGKPSKSVKLSFLKRLVSSMEVNITGVSVKGTSPCFRKALQFQRGPRSLYISKSNSSQQKFCCLTGATFFPTTCVTTFTLSTVRRELTISPEKYLYINATTKL